MDLVYDKVCPMCRMGLIHGLEAHTFYGGEVSFNFELRPTPRAADGANESPPEEALREYQESNQSGVV